MPAREPIRMRRREDATRAREHIVVIAAVAGVLALAIGVGAVLAGAFARPAGTAPPTSTGSAAAASSPSTRAASPHASASATSTSSATKMPSTRATTSSKRAVAKKLATKKAVAKAPAPATPPLGMAHVLSGSKQLIVATGAKLGSTHGTLRVFNLAGGAWKQVFSAPCRFGTNGLIDGTKRHEGSRTTPTGIWWPGTWVWGWHKAAPAGTLMPYRQTTAKVWWSDERNSTYNTWVVSSSHVSGEHLVDVRVQYEFALSSGYNASPNTLVRGRGTAIFLHVFDPPDFHNGLSAGCVTLSRANMIRVFQTVDPTLRPCFAIGTEAAGTPTSIASY